MHKIWSILFGVTMIGAVVLFLVAPAMGWWLPKNVASFGDKVDNLFYAILYVTGFFFVLTEAALVYFMFKYAGNGSAKPQAADAPATPGFFTQTRVEIAWTIVPAVILIVLALVQVQTWAEIKYPADMPKPDQILEVSARQFEWRMRYPATEQLQAMVGSWQPNNPPTAWVNDPHADDLYVVNEVHVWKGAHVRVYLKTRDVLHSFYLPNLRLKQDAVPGRVIPVWFKVTESNTVKNGDHWEDGMGRDPKTGKANQPEQVWDLVCAELCGWGHYKMAGRLYVHPDQADFEAWRAHAQAEQDKRQP